ncbi:hypothetical protein [Streptomyces sp. I05A-00742]|uniref:hypothetical protein n=1 Tax=Streptomyces sp. I05A-00742 TaxID=2732853 RepID=UPI001489667D|nr:hypothetical protein [Streptomyces sp. I05A-00742]
MLKGLYRRVRAVHRFVTYRMLAGKAGVSLQTVGAWMNGDQAPDGERVLAFLKIVRYLESLSSEPRLPPGVWERAVKRAQDEADRRQGTRQPQSEAATPALSRIVHSAPAYLARNLSDRRRELDELAERSRTGPGYSALIAPPWAGKTALLAAFVTAHVPKDVDVVSYFVRHPSRADTAQDFLDTMVAQLGEMIGGKRPRVADKAVLFALYEKAAQRSLSHGRSVLLVVDGLDEDAGAGLGRQSIASLLPKVLPPGLRVLVSRRWHPPVPADVDDDHPLREADVIPNFRPSPAAQRLREAALQDLTALLTQPVGKEVVGFLVLARGGLGYGDLAELLECGGHVPAPDPFDLKRMLRNVAGRGLTNEDLDPDTYVLAHEELYSTAVRELGNRRLDSLTQRLHDWADSYRMKEWPPDTPLYLLNGYQELLRTTGDIPRYLTFALDHRRQLRLANLYRADLALASLDEVARLKPTPEVLAQVAASRYFLEREDRAAPRAVLHALALVGDTARARSLALTPKDPASKAVRLMAVAQESLGRDEKAAAELACEAASWAGRARYQNALRAPAEELDAEGIVSRAGALLAAVGRPDEAVRLLDTVDVCHPSHFPAAAEAASRLLGSHPDRAAELLDELTDEADYLAFAAEEQQGVAVEMWIAVATADPARAELLHRRMTEFALTASVEAVGPTAVDCAALAASALAGVRPEDARALADVAHDRMRALLAGPVDDRTGETLPRVVRSLLDVDGSPDRARRLLDEAPAEITTRARIVLGGHPDEANETDRLLAEIRHHADRGAGPEARDCLARLFKSSRREGGEQAITWLAFLSEALVLDGEQGAAEVHALAAGEPDSAVRVRILTSAALAHADVGRLDEASRCAEEAESVARGIGVVNEEAVRVRGLVAQAFAHAGSAERAQQWAASDTSRRTSGWERGYRRRVALAVEVGLAPEAIVSGVGRPRLLGAYGAHIAGALLHVAAGTSVDAELLTAEDEARARGGTEPVLVTGLALLHAARGDVESSRRVVDYLTDPVQRATAMTAVAAHLLGVPAHLDVAATADDEWAVSVLRVLAQYLLPVTGGDQATAKDIVRDVLGTGGWYQVLPVLSRRAPDAVHPVLDVLDHHRQVRQTAS